MPTVFTVELDRIKLLENGAVARDAEGVNALAASLFYPREGLPSATAARPLKLVDNVGLLFNGEPLENRLLFKESVRGSTALKIEVSAIDEPSRIDKAFSAIFGAALTAVSGGISNAVLAAASSTAVGSLFEAFGPKKKVSVIAQGRLDLDESFQGGQITIPLSVPKDLRFFDMRLDENGDPIRNRKTLRKDQPNGKVVVNISRLGT